MSKVQAVCGDVSVDELGVEPEMKRKLISEVSIVFHGAATLNLDAQLTDAINLNTRGTLRMLEFCSDMKNLEVFNFALIRRALVTLIYDISIRAARETITTVISASDDY